MKGNGIWRTISGGLRRLVPGFIRDRYLAKFLVIMLLVVVVIASVGAAGYMEATNSVEEDTDAQLQSTVTMQADSIGTWVDQKERQTNMISETEQVRSGDTDEIQPYMTRHWRSFDVEGIHYVDTDRNQITASSEPSAVDQSLDGIDEPWTNDETFESLTSPSDVWTADQAHPGSIHERDVITFVSPITGWDGRYIVVVAGIEDQVDALYQQSTAQSTTILNTDGEQVMTADDEADQQAAADRNQDAFDTVFDPNENLENASVSESANTVYAYKQVPGTNWVAVTSTPKTQAYAVADTVRNSIGAIVGVSLIALVGAAVVLGRHTVTPLTRLRSRVKRMEEGDLEVDLETRRSDEIGQLYGGFATMRDSLRERIAEVQNARADAESARDEAEHMNQHLEAKADEYNDVIDEWAEGDLTQRLDPESENAAMTEIAEDLNEMVADLEIALDNVKGFANQTAVASEQVTASTEQVRSASRQVTDSIQEISAGAERQNEKLITAAEEMNNLSATTQEITSLSVEVADIAERTAETGQEGREAAQEAIDAMEEIEEGSEHAVEAIRELEEEEVAQIDELIESISDIAKETNMLALNANIEASRSAGGENADGEGFGVVAHEIKELAQDAKGAADEIETRLEAIRQQTKRSASEVEQNSELIEDASQRVQKTVEGLEEIAEYAEETNTGVQEISGVTEAQADSTEAIVTQVEEVTSISEETTAEAETVASAAEEQTAGLVETSQSIEDLSRRATSLSDALDRFETDVDDDQVPADDDELQVL
ncbi:methyl-accepting chemotaxis protein [Natronoglomus mannanivorans]|uniref:Methyl-accepting chemotaxis protein n=1 Tax=Natronoglomus mannanivorans TaxID=2979990 RepID=A0AAP2YYQ6_9EURY|nr:methyl-accepting chemotaxis protein [Halobacteria archaeon AArc-xg1-1]